MRTLALVLVALVAPASALAHAGVTPQDRAATRAYLHAIYAYQQSLASGSASSKVAVEKLASELGSECRGVLAGAPRESRESFLEERTARERGEASRTERQERELEQEIGQAFDGALVEPVRGRTLAFAHTLASLRWSHARVTRYVHALALRAESVARATTLPVCADLKAWAASGYRQLSSATKSLARQQESLEASLSEQEGSKSPGALKLLRETEVPDEQPLKRAIRKLEGKVVASLRGLQSVGEGLDRTLGTHTAEEEREQPPKGGVVIAHGTTATGGSYTIWVQQKSSAPEPRCDVQLGYEEFETRRDKHGSGGSGFGSDACLSRSHPEGVRAHCNGTQWQIEGQTVEGATTATLNVRGGAQVSSPVALVPSSLGGPLGFYFELLPASEDPVSLAELDAQGRVLTTVPLPHEAKCPGRPRGVPPAPRPPKPLGGATIVAGRVPHGPRFQIMGELDRFMGRIERHLSVIVFGEHWGGEIGSGEELVLGRRHPRPFEPKLESGCQPHEFAILYGLLKAPDDIVLAKTRSGLRPFRTAAIPRKLHMHGVLAYIVLDSTPTRVIVRSRSGRTVSSANFRKSARESRETCEGEAEP